MATVTPRAGVWIEITRSLSLGMAVESLPVRECGLKCMNIGQMDIADQVTPRAGVWIEINKGMQK